jgi:hypothetical protein
MFLGRNCALQSLARESALANEFDDGTMCVSQRGSAVCAALTVLTSTLAPNR